MYNTAKAQPINSHNNLIYIFPTKTPREKRSHTDVLANHTSVDPISNPEHIQQIINYFLTHKDNKNHVWLRNAMWFIIGCNTSYRVSDLCRLQGKDIFDKSGNFKTHILIKALKTRKLHKVPITENIKSIITLYFTTINKSPTQEDYLFDSAKGEHLTEDRIQKVMKLVQRELNLPYNLGSHSLRKTATRRMFDLSGRNNIELVRIQEILGHRDWSTTLRYIGITQEDQDAMFEKLDIGLEIEAL